MRKELIIFCILLGLTTLSQVQCRIMIESGSLNGTTIATGQFYKKGDDFTSVFEPINGFLVLENASDADVHGRIVIMKKVPTQSIYAGFFALQARGAIGILYVTQTLVPGQYFCTYTGEDVQRLIIPVAEVTFDDFSAVQDLVAQGEIIFVTLSSEGNEWTNLIVNGVTTIIVYRVILGGAGAAIIGYALYKLIMLIKLQGSQFNVPQVCLGLEIIENLWRVLWVSGDPLGCFYVYGSAITSFLDTISLPYSTATFVLITFYWHEAVSDSSIKIYPFLAKLKIPFFVIMLVIIGIDLIISLLGYYLGIDSSVLAYIYIVISTAFVIFYFITVGKITKRLKKAQSIGKKYAHLSSVNRKMILNGITKILFVIVCIVFAVRTINGVPVPQYIVTIMFVVVTDLDSWARIFLFDIRKKSKSGSSNKGTNSSDKNTRRSVRTASTTNMVPNEDDSTLDVQMEHV